MAKPKLSKIAKFIKHTELTREVAVELDADLLDITNEMEAEIKEATPVVTGILKSSMTARKIGFLKYEVATGVVYANAVEFGMGFAPRAMMRIGAARVDKQGTKLLRRSGKLF